MTDKRVVVTGAAGFLGSHLTDRLLADGYAVVGVDNLVTGDMANLAHLDNEARFEFQELDVIDPFEIAGQVDGVLHFASPASPIDYLELPIETLKVGSFGTYNTLELARSKNARYFVASTSEVYGDPKLHPQPESYWGNVNPIGPRSVYDEAKRFGEAMTMAYHTHFGVDTRIVRIFNTFGPRMRLNDGRAVPNFMKQALRGDPITVYGDGSQTRSFCYVDDLIDGIVRLYESNEHMPVNVGNPVEWTILQMADAIIDIADSGSEIVLEPLPQDDPKVRKPDITKAREILGWQPGTDVYDGLARTMADFKTRLGL
jgi:dTDP-glucose 4,6-dehydratase